MNKVLAARAFITIVEQGSFVAAAKLLGISAPSASRCVTEMEDWAKTKLLHRSTRKLSLTPAGEKMLERCRSFVEIADDISNSSITSHSAPSGTLRVSCSHYFAQLVIIPVIAQYMARYPEVHIELSISNHVVDLVEERIDLAIRISNKLDPNLIARKIGETRSILCASPDYLAKHAAPVSPQDLRHHNCLIYTNFENPHWRLFNNDEMISVPVSGTLTSYDAMVIQKATIAGLGISMQPIDGVKDHLDSGVLVPILPQFKLEHLNIHCVFLSRKNMPIAQRKMIDMLVTHFKQQS